MTTQATKSGQFARVATNLAIGVVGLVIVRLIVQNLPMFQEAGWIVNGKLKVAAGAVIVIDALLLSVLIRFAIEIRVYLVMRFTEVPGLGAMAAPWRSFVAKIISLLLFLGLALGAALAQSENAAELATQDVGPVNVVLTSGAWTPLLSADFKKPGKKDLFIAVSLECGLFTGNASDAFADAAVVVRVSVDGHGTRPGVVSFCGKSNGSEAPFALLANCTSSSLNSCGLTAEEQQQISRSLRSHDFNFVLINIPKGIQHITVQGKVATGATSGPAFGVIGKGSVEAMVVNLKEEAE